MSRSELLERLCPRLASADVIPRHVEGYRPAAVAVILLEREGQLVVPLTVRATHLTHHSGQIAFPGGRVDKDDRTISHTALRELEEEIGITQGLNVVGALPQLSTPTGFAVTPVVMSWDGEQPYRIDSNEVSHLFEAPLAQFADPANGIVLGEPEFAGKRYIMRGYDIGPHRVWGATARILEMLWDNVLRFPV